MLSAAQLAGMQATQNSALPDICTIRYRTTIVNSTTHIGTDAWTNRGTGIACRVAIETPPRLSDDPADRLFSRVAYLIYVPYNQIALARDQVLTGGRTFEVISVLADSWNTILPLRCWEVLASV